MTGRNDAASATAPTATSPGATRCVDLIDGVVHEVNYRLAGVEQIKTFRLLPKELDHEDGELTATQKVKRSAIATSFEELGRLDVRRRRPMTELLEAVMRGWATVRSTPCSPSGS